MPKKLAPTRFAKPSRSPPLGSGGLEVLSEEGGGLPDMGKEREGEGGGDWAMGDSGGGGWDEGMDQLMDAAVEMDMGEGEERKEEEKEPTAEV